MASPENNKEIVNPSDQPNADQGQAPVGLDESARSDDADTGGNAYAFSDLSANTNDNQPGNLDFILDIPLEITVELGRTKMLIHDLLKLGQGSVIELPKAAGETLEILANNRLIAKGDVVVMNDKYGIRLTEVISTVERLENLK
jgi:flagellar motor switch protein FliN/FliY